MGEKDNAQSCDLTSFLLEHEPFAAAPITFFAYTGLV